MLNGKTGKGGQIGVCSRLAVGVLEKLISTELIPLCESLLQSVGHITVKPAPQYLFAQRHTTTLIANDVAQRGHGSGDAPAIIAAGSGTGAKYGYYSRLSAAGRPAGSQQVGGGQHIITAEYISQVRAERRGGRGIVYAAAVKPDSADLFSEWGQIAADDLLQFVWFT